MYELFLGTYNLKKGFKSFPYCKVVKKMLHCNLGFFFHNTSAFSIKVRIQAFFILKILSFTHKDFQNYSTDLRASSGYYKH